MPAATKKRPALATEASEGKAHEMGESPEEETREGSEPESAPSFKTNRKRSAKNANNTKAPMDTEGCGCGGGKAKKCTCDGGCGGYAKKIDRNDALTAQEYLAACDLGIQDRSRPYIRARLDTADRLDKKCGGSGIPDNAKCSKGGGPGVGGVLMGAAAVAGAAGLASVAHSALKNKAEKEAKLARVNQLRKRGKAGKNVARALLSKFTAERENSPARQRRKEKNPKRLPMAKVERRVRRHGKVIVLNSMYADGFSPDLTQLGL